MPASDPIAASLFPWCRLSVSGRALSGAAAELATYHFAQRHAGTTSEWFQAAVRDIVKHVDEAPMLQTVQLGVGGAEPRCSTYSVHPSVVAVPEVSGLACLSSLCMPPATGGYWLGASAADTGNEWAQANTPFCPLP
jgi:hypothetical protein